jgi:uncharacterized protein YjdB
MRAANTRPTLAFALTLAGVLGAFGTFGCFSGRSLTDPGSGNPGTGFRPPTSQVALVTLSPSSISGRPGDSTTVSATLKDSSGAVVTDSAVYWSSTDSSVATVSANGRVRLWHKGRSWIHIKVGGLTDSVPTTVTNPVLATIQLSPTSITGVPGSTTQISAVLADSTGATMTSPPALAWTSSNSSVAKVSGSGLVTLVNQGAATITASASGVSATVGVTVNAPPVGPVASIALSPSAITGIPGNTTQVSAALADANGVAVTGVTVSWSSSNTAVATISSSGLVTLVKQGAATIKASAGGVTATIGATVNAAPVASLALTPTSITGVPGNTTQESAVAKDASGNTVSGQTVSWASSDATIANVSSSGLVTLKKQGSTTITGSDGSISATVAVTVNAPPVAAIALSPTTVTGVPGNTAQLSAVPEDASGNALSGISLTWTSSNTAIATVSGGTVSLVKQGTATITVAGGGVSAAATVTVNAPAPPVVSAVVVTPSSLSLKVGQTSQLTATAVDASGNAMPGASISWTSSNTRMATVSGAGMVQAMVAGAVIMTATSGGHAATSSVQIAAAQPPSSGPSNGWNMPAGMTVVCQTGTVTSSSPGFSMPSGGSINFGGPVPCAWTRNGGDGSIGLASSSTNPDGSANNDVQASGYRVMFPAGQVNDAAWNMYFSHAGGTGTYYIGWKQRWQPHGSYAALLSAMNSGDSKVWAPKGPSGGDLTIMSWMGFGSTPVIGLNFQGVDGHNIPDVNQTGGGGTIPVSSAMTLPGVAAGNGAWDQEEVLIVGNGNTSTSTVSFFVNGVAVGTATGVTNASAWTATEQYLSRSIYSGTQAQTTYTDLDQVTVAVK